ncbi:MAG TPA: DUF255 domain-containing protein [Candidatus Binatia bacterium]
MLRFSPNQNLSRLIRWFESEDDAFATAEAQGRPVALFLGAFRCRYCQRMDEEAFSDRENMALLNAYFVALRAENAKRPDIDARYSLNGWPTIAFLSPNGKLLAAVNYLPAAEFKELLLNVYMEYQRCKEELRVDQLVASADPPVSQLSRRPPAVSSANKITDTIMAAADHENGGYGRGQKFIHPEVNEFLLCRYEQTHDARFLDHVRLTLERMRRSAIYDENEGGYFRTTTGADWVQPHREKLLIEQAGLVLNCVHLFRITGSEDHARMGEEIIGYLDRKLFDSEKPAFFGCEDFLRDESSSPNEFFTIIDDCIYTDANSLAVIAYLDAAAVLKRPEYQERALKILDFLWYHNRDEQYGMFHYFDSAPQIPGLLIDQARMGIALARAFAATGDDSFLDRAAKLADIVLSRQACAQGGYFDRGPSPLGFFGPRLLLIDQNGLMASFFLMLANATKEPKYRDAALAAFSAFQGDFTSYGIHAAPLGQALVEWLTMEQLE